jgi:hypothetical protein
MEHCDNIFDKIQELLGCIPGTVSILEEQIDADIQLEYYNCSCRLKNTFIREEVLKKRELIFTSDIGTEDKKDLIVKLASIDSVDAYRTLERFATTSETPLKDWAMLAFKENKLLLESKLLDKSQVLISTGLGGKGMKLRYFTVFFCNKLKSFSRFQRKLIEDEFAYAITKSFGEPENISFDKELCTMLSIIPLQVSVQRLFDNLIDECNQFGNFIRSDYIITNVKIIPNNEVRKITSGAIKQKTREN